MVEVNFGSAQENIFLQASKKKLVKEQLQSSLKMK